MLDRGRIRGLTEVPYLRNVNVQWGRLDVDDVLTMEFADDERERFGLRAGDLLVCEGGKIGRAAIWSGSDTFMAYQKALHRVRPSAAVEGRFLLHLFAHYASSGYLAARATGSTIMHLPQQQLRRLRVPLPPIEEQWRIVDILEDHLSRLDAANQLLRSAEKRLLAYRRAHLDTLTETRAIKHVPLAELIDRVEAGRSFGSSAPPAQDGEWGIIKVSAMTWGEFRPDENKAVIEVSRIESRYEIKPNDLLVSRANTTEYVGAPVLVRDTPPRLLLSDKSLRLVPHAECLPEYVLRVLSAPRARRQMSRRATGTKDSMRNISQPVLLSIEVPWVPSNVQAEVVAEAKESDAHADRLHATLQVEGARSGGLRRGLLHAAFSGRLTGSFTDTDIIEELAGV